MSVNAIDVRSQSELLVADTAKSNGGYIGFLKVNGWSSEYKSVDALLKHLSRKSGSEASKITYLRRLFSFCLYARKNPDELIRLPKGEIERLVQAHADGFNNGRYSTRYANNALALLRTFFEVNGFKKGNALDVEGYYMPARYRKIPEYIPFKHEVYLMADSACSLRDRAIILTIYSSGIRNSTLRALLYKDVKDELSGGICNIVVPVYPEMKLVDPNACKNKIPYYSFVCDEATQAIRLYLREREQKYGRISDNELLFASEYNQISKERRTKKVMSSRQVQNVVKFSAKRAGIPQWHSITCRSLRKASETVLHSELVDGGRLDPKIQEFFMGHILPGSQDNYFDSTKVEELRMEYSGLNFGRTIIDNKFKVLRSVVAKAFEGTGIDPDRVMEEYMAMKRRMSTR